MFNVEVSPGELCDKLSILKIKLEKVKDASALTFIEKEFNLLNSHKILEVKNIDKLYNDLYNINKQLWDLENQVRKLENEKKFGEEFINAARTIYKFNDKRALVKKEINIQLNSELQEIKQHN